MCYVVGRGNADFQHISVLSLETLSSFAADWSDVALLIDDVFLDYLATVWIAPDLPGKAFDCFNPCRRPLDLMDLLPLPVDGIGVGTAAVPARNF